MTGGELGFSFVENVVSEKYLLLVFDMSQDIVYYKVLEDKRKKKESDGFNG